MLEITRIYLSSGILLVAMTLVFHLIAIGYPRWKVYEHRRTPNETMFIGLFHRCENRLVNVIGTTNRYYPICDENRYLPPDRNLSDIIHRYPLNETPRLCNVAGNPYRCDYSPITKGLISTTILAACLLIFSLLLIYLHLLINQFKYKTHLLIAGITIALLLLAFLFILTTLILLGSTMSFDLFEFRYNFRSRLLERQRQNRTNGFEQSIRQAAASDYDIRLDWSAGLEIIALVLTSFTLVSQILYLFSTYRNRIG